MVRIVLCVLCLVALASSAGAHMEWIDPFHTHERRPTTGDRWGQQLQQERRDWQQQRQQDRRDMYFGENPLTTFDCLGEKFKTCSRNRR